METDSVSEMSSSLEYEKMAKNRNSVILKYYMIMYPD
jgi:uncharacterized protein with HEPN domain